MVHEITFEVEHIEAAHGALNLKVDGFALIFRHLGTVGHPALKESVPGRKTGQALT